MKWIEALVGTRADGKSLLPGGIYQISDEDADFLIRNGRAKLAEPKDEAPAPGVELTEGSFKKKCKASETRKTGTRDGQP